MRGFLVGTLTLIAASTLLQPNAAKSANAASNVAVSLLRRALSGEVAGVPQKAGGSGSGSGGPTQGFGPKPPGPEIGTPLMPNPDFSFAPPAPARQGFGPAPARQGFGPR